MGFIVVLKGIAVRFVFACHVTVCAWRVVAVAEMKFSDKKVWLTLGLLSFLGLMEAVWTLGSKKRGSYKWFCPMTFLYLCGVVPCIWILEWDLFKTRIAYMKLHNASCDPYLHDSIFNVTKAPRLPNAAQFALYLTDPEWSRGLQQVLLLLLILGRWFRPKGNISRDQLSQLLLVYVGTSADILEFSTEGLQMEQVMCSQIYVTLVLSVWAWSLLQFTLSLTVTLSREQDDKCNACGNVYFQRRRQRQQRKQQRDRKCSCMCCETEVWAIVVSMVMQDVPFLLVRIHLLLQNEVININQAGFFFICKNALVILLQMYRLSVIVVEYYRGRRKRKVNVLHRPGDVICATGVVGSNERDAFRSDSQLQNPAFILSAWYHECEECNTFIKEMAFKTRKIHMSVENRRITNMEKIDCHGNNDSVKSAQDKTKSRARISTLPE